MPSFVSNILILCGLALLAGFGYYLFVIQGESTTLSNTSEISEVRLTNEEFVRKLNEIKTVTLSDEIFADARFRSLVDYAKPVPTQPLGRSNPFDPVE